MIYDMDAKLTLFWRVGVILGFETVEKVLLNAKKI